MANELVYAGDPDTESGLTLEAKVYGPLPGTVTQVGSDQAATESGSTAIYRANMPTASAGNYLVRFHDTADDSIMAQALLGWDGSKEVAAFVDTIADGLFDKTDGIETGTTLRQGLRLFLASLAGKLSGAATTTVSIRDKADTKDRIIATVDADGNRSAITYDVT